MIKEFQDAAGQFVRKPEWPIWVADDLGVLNTYYTGSNGELQVCGLAAGSYAVEEDLSPMPNSSVAALIVNGNEIVPLDTIYAFTWAPGKPAPVILFKNVPYGGGGGQ